MAVADQTIRFRAESRITYARALVALTRIARETARDFEYGPLDMAALEDQGLVLTGSGVTEWADDFMGQVPGLYRDE